MSSPDQQNAQNLPKGPATGGTVAFADTPKESGSTPPVGQSETNGGTAFIMPPRPQNPNEREGTVLMERYKVLSRIGEGGMGTVYLAEHLAIRKKFALKVLSPEYAHKQDLVERFLQEARAASMIEQENVVEITDFGNTPDGSVFFVMEYLQGEDLSRLIKREGRLPWSRVKPIAMQICRALQAAHNVGIIHRDMKPENCFRVSRHGNEDFIKVLDFGIAKLTGDGGDGGKGLTRTGMIFGTPEYMAPEQAQGAKPDHRVDIYALGVILYEMVTGQTPFSGDTFMAVLTKHMFEAPRPPTSLCPDAGIAAEVEAIVMKALEKDASRRFQSMDEMSLAMDSVGTGAIVLEQRPSEPSGRIVLQGGWGESGTSTSPIGQTVMHGSGPVTGVHEDEYGQRSRGGNRQLPLLLALGGLACAVGVGAWMALKPGTVAPAGGKQSENQAAQVAVVDVKPSNSSAVVPAEPVLDTAVEPEVVAEVPSTVEFVLHTDPNEVRVVRKSDQKILATAMSGQPFSLERGQGPVDAMLEANGYETKDIVLDVSSGGEYSFTLEAERPSRPTSRGSRSPKRSSHGQVAAQSDGVAAQLPAIDPPKEKPVIEPPKEEKKNPTITTSPDLRNPFEKR